MAMVFWVSAAFVAYVYAGYPLLLRAWARVRAHRCHPAAAPVDPNPGRTVPEGVSVVIAARNEGARLAARLDNLLTLDYPADRRQIIVVCDGCSDDTQDVLRHYAGVVDTVVLPSSGKALSLNAGLTRARFPIVVFADARQAFAGDALHQLTAPFQDPAVGAVTGELLLDCESALFSNRRTEADRRLGRAQPGAPPTERRIGVERRRAALSSIADGVGFYWRYEKQLRRLESRIASTLGATGAIYAMRRSLWRPLPAETILDDVLAPMRVVMAGYRVVFNEQAKAFDRAAVDADAETRRKVRTLAGNYQILWLEPALLLPWRNPVWLQYVSHKLGRLAVPYAMLAIFSTNIALAGTHVLYQASLAAQVLFYLLAGYGAVLEMRSHMHASAGRNVQRSQAHPPAAAAAREIA